MMSILGISLALGGVIAYFALVLFHVPVWQEIPYVFLGVLATGTALAVVPALRRPALGTIAAAAVAISVFGFSTWYFFDFSMYDSREQRPAVGDVFPDFTLADSTGQPFTLTEHRGKRLLVLLYRGDW